MPVIDIARRAVVTITPDETVADVVRTMDRESVSSVVVVEDGKPLGLVNERDLALAVLDEELDAEGTSIDAFTAEEVVTIDADAGLYDLVELCSEQGIRRVPVVDDEDLVGIISLSDVVVLLGMELQHVATAIRSTSPAYEQPVTNLDIFQ
ncbi:MAG: CBS domain-containing protein [Haloarculaceae archaeon]|jgi:CBS domain-containing protein